jgi:DnaJ like chaperone protein
MVGILDYKYYKWAAIIPGFIIGDIVGAIAAYFLVQELMRDKEEDISFDIALLRICSLLIKSDGTVDQIEVDTVREFFRRTYGANKTNLIFRKLKSSKLSRYTLDQLINVIKNNMLPTKYYSVIQLLYAIAASDGNISPSEDEFIWVVGTELNFTRGRLEAIKNQFVKVKTKSNKYDQKTLQFLGVLGLKGGEDKSEIKTAYRTLAKEFHPDKLSGMSQGIQDLAKEKFQLIQEAYEYLNKNYV